jgi:hypothetical protein
MTEPKYNIGDFIKTYSNLTGTISGFKYDEVSKEWLYNIENVFITKESNIRKNVLDSPTDSSNNLLDNKTKRKKK